MSTSFGPSNLFGGTADSNASVAPTLGLRQRPSAAARTNNANGADENANPNNAPLRPRDGNTKTTYGKWGSMSKVPAPPRASLSTAGKYSVSAGRSATGLQQRRGQQQMPTENNVGTTASHQSLIPVKEKADVDLSLWVVGYGYPSEAHFRELYQRLERCGTITSRRGGLSSCFGEGVTDSADNGNWVAVRYESELCAHKALCQHGNFVSLGGSTMIMGVMPLRDAAAQLSINVDGSYGSSSSKREGVTLSGSYNKRHRNELKSEEDIILYGNEQHGDGTIDDEVKSSLDSLCGKVLAWFFMWDTQA